jgi:ADP-heptose:LPS heptosyltransferase
MNIDLMRKIDYWAGIPVCFFSTWILRIFNLKKNILNQKNVLLIELSEMGSTILCDPMMQKLKREGYKVHFVIFNKNVSSLYILNTVEQSDIFTIRESSLITLVMDFFRYIAWCRSKNIGSVVDLELFSRFTALLSGFSGASQRVGFHAFFNEGLYRGDMLTHKVAYNPHLHIAKNFISLANALLSEKQEIPYSKNVVGDDEINLNKAIISEIQKRNILSRVCESLPGFNPAIHRIVIFNANASDLMPLRRWPRGNYIELGEMLLLKYPDIFILLTGSSSEHDGLDVIRVMLGDRCINFAGKTKFEDLAPLYSISRLMLTNDSGPAHFSAVTDLPTFVIFGPETPALYGSLGNSTPIYANLACSPCVTASNHRKSACNDNQCVKVISPEYVYNLLSAELDRG